MRSKILHTYLPFILLSFTVLSTVLFRMRLLDVPLERDEGEYAYIGQLILDGTPPYSEAYNMKFPGIYFIYAGILWFFGQTHTAIHFCLLLVNVFSIILLFFFARTAYDGWVGAAGAGAFSLLSMSYHVQGYWANAEHFVLPFIIGANLLLLLALRNNRIGFVVVSAFLFGCAALVKQHGAFFGMFGCTAMFLSLWKYKTIEKKFIWKYLFAFFGGLLIPVLLCFFYLAYAGVLKKFYLWTFFYAKEYSSLVPTIEIKYNFIGSFYPLWHFASLLWIIAGVGCIALLLPPRIFPVQNRQSSLIILGIFIAGIIALSIGFYFRPHYFILILPAVAILFGVGIRFIFHFFSTASLPITRYFPPVFIVTIAMFGTLASHWDVLYTFSPAEVTRTVYGASPFPFSSLIAKLIQEKTSKNDRIAIIGSEPQFLFYSQRKSATSFMYTYSLTEDQPFAEQFRLDMIHQVESAMPKLLVFTQVKPEWYKKTTGEMELTAWFSHFTKVQYISTARFEYSSSDDTVLITNPTLLVNKPTHIFWISMYERR
jgi:hypothetical protein